MSKKASSPNEADKEDIEELTIRFQALMEEKDKKIKELEDKVAEYEAIQLPTKIDPATREKAGEQVKVLGLIRRKLSKLKPITMSEYEMLVEYTDPAIAVVVPRGDDVATRRQKIITVFQIIWDWLKHDDFDFTFENDNSTFAVILEHIRHIVKENMSGEQTVEKILKERFA